MYAIYHNCQYPFPSPHRHHQHETRWVQILLHNPRPAGCLDFSRHAGGRFEHPHPPLTGLLDVVARNRKNAFESSSEIMTTAFLLICLLKSILRSPEAIKGQIWRNIDISSEMCHYLRNYFS